MATTKTRTPAEKVIRIPLDQLHLMACYPIQQREDASFQETVNSIKEHGVLQPAIVRPREGGGYEIIAGRRRKIGCELAQLPDMPCIVRNLDDDQATIAMVDTDIHRENVLPSEKGAAYKMKLEAIKRQGKRREDASRQDGGKLEAADIVGEESGESGRTVQRYIRLTELIPPVLDMVDSSKIAFRPAVELSYLSKEQQQSLYDTMECEDCTPSLAQAIKMKEFSRDGKLTEEVILSIMQEEKPNQREQFKMPKERISKYFAPGTPAQKIEDTIVKALELYRRRERQRDMER